MADGPARIKPVIPVFNADIPQVYAELFLQSGINIGFLQKLLRIRKRAFGSIAGFYGSIMTTAENCLCYELGNGSLPYRVQSEGKWAKLQPKCRNTRWNLFSDDEQPLVMIVRNMRKPLIFGWFAIRMERVAIIFCFVATIRRVNKTMPNWGA